MTETSRRFDSVAEFRKAPRLDRWGNMIVDAIVVKPGVYSYHQPDGSIRREFKPPEEIYAPSHMESVRSAVITDGHLPGNGAVTPGNFSAFSRGYAMSASRTDAGLLTSMKVTASDLIAKLERKEIRGVSLGLDVTYDPTPGVWQGQRYDGVQRGMMTNQISATTVPRVGGAEMRLDSTDAIMVDEMPPEPKEEQMTIPMKLTIGDSIVEVETGAGAVIQARLKVLDSELDSAKSQITSLTGERDGLQAKLDTAGEELEKAKKLTVDSKDIPALFAARRTLLDGAAVLLDEEGLKAVDSLPDMDVMRKACEAGKIDLEGKSDEYVSARFDALVEARRDTNANSLAAAVANVTSIHGGQGDGKKTPRERVAEARASRNNAWKKEG